MNNNPQQLPPNSLGKLPPQAVDAENAVLGACLIDKWAFPTIAPILSKNAFYSDKNGIIYAALERLFKENNPIDLMTVTQELRSTGELEMVGGAFCLTELTFRINSGANVEAHARFIQEKYLARQIIHLGNTLLRSAYDDTTDVFELIGEAEKGIFDISKFTAGKDPKHIFDLLLNKMKVIENKKDGELEGYLTGLSEVDNIFRGVKKKKLIIIAARPSMGKTAAAVTIAKNIATLQKIPLALFSLESSNEEIADRYISQSSSIPLDYVSNSIVTGVMFKKLMQEYPRTKESKLYIDDERCTTGQLRSKIRKMILLYGIEVAIVDYLQLIIPDNPKNTREQQIMQISNDLKQIAKEFNIPVIALAQLSRDVDKRTGDNRPVLSDLRDGGAIEQDADIVAFLFRPEYYGKKEDENGQPLIAGQTEWIIRKHRDGCLGTAQTILNKDLTRFENLNTQYQDTGEYSTYGKDVDNKDLGVDKEPF